MNPEVVSIVHIADNICSISNDVDRIIEKLPEIVKRAEMDTKLEP